MCDDRKEGAAGAVRHMHRDDIGKVAAQGVEDLAEVTCSKFWMRSEAIWQNRISINAVAHPFAIRLRSELLTGTPGRMLALVVK